MPDEDDSNSGKDACVTKDRHELYVLSLLAASTQPEEHSIYLDAFFRKIYVDVVNSIVDHACYFDEQKKRVELVRYT